MRALNTAAVAMLVAILGGQLTPAPARTVAKIAWNGGSAMAYDGHEMSRGMKSDGCAGMMQSMGGSNEPPNSQWHARPPASEPRSR
jgi:hypothetical protein